MTTKLSTANFQQNALDAFGGAPKISNVAVTNSSFSATGAANVSTSGGYVKVTGTKFATGAQVLIDETPATAVTVVNTSIMNVQVPAKVAGTYFLYVVNTDGSTGIRVNGVSYSA